MKQIFILLFSIQKYILSADGSSPDSEASAKIKPSKIMVLSLDKIHTIAQLSTFLNTTKHRQAYTVQDVTDAVSRCDETGSQIMRKLYILNHINSGSKPLTMDILRTIIHIAAKAPEHDDVIDGYTHRHSIRTHYLQIFQTSKTLDSSSDKDVH